MIDKKETLELLYQVYDFTTEEELDQYLLDCEVDQFVNLLNEILETCHCNAPRYCGIETDWKQIIDVEIRCFKEFDWKQYEIIIEDQYNWYELGIDWVIDDMIAYEEEAEALSFYKNTDE